MTPCQLPFFLEADFMAGLACSCCGEAVDAGPDWRWNGREWEHRCPHVHPQAGPFVALPKEQP